MGREGVVQHACVEALSHYCSGSGIKFHAYPPYNSEQGAKLNQYCADLIGVLDNCSLLLLEVKELVGARLPEFREDQHAELLKLETQGIPVAYGYNIIDVRRLASSEKETGWEVETLKRIKRSEPSRLPDATPDSANHMTLLSWVETARRSGGGDNFARFGRALNKAAHPDFLRNWFLTMVYSPSGTFALEPEQLTEVYRWLEKLSKTPSPNQISAKIARLQSAARIFPPKTKPTELIEEEQTDSSRSKPRFP